MDINHLSLQLLRFAAEDRAYRSVLEALADGISEAGARVEDAAKSDDQVWQEIVIDEESELAENLLGAAFIVCQAQITAITSRARKARERVLHKRGSFSAFGEGKKPVRDLGERLPPPATETKVEMLWALANYFKHREEWPHDWSKVDDKQKLTKRTIAVIEQAGLSSGSTGNLRTAAEYFGNAGDYTRAQLFADIVDAWAERVVSAVKTELGAA